MHFARWVFRIAAIYGFLVTTPLFFLEDRIGRDYPPPIAHPEYFYGFACLVITWQLVFLLISHDPARYRPLMLVSILEKFSFVIPVPILFAMGRVATNVLGFSMIDALLAVLFGISWWKTRAKRAAPALRDSKETI